MQNKRCIFSGLLNLDRNVLYLPTYDFIKNLVYSLRKIFEI